MKKAIIFDLDGTLINSLPDIAASMNRALNAHGLSGYAVEDYRLKVGNGVFNLARRAVGENTDKLQGVLAYYMEDYAKTCAISSAPYDGIDDMLKALVAHGLKVSILSNKDQRDVESVVEHYFPDIPFALVRGRVEGVPLKPDPTGAILMAQQLRLAPSQCFYSGDTMMDMCCGNDAGMETIGVTWGFRDVEELKAHHAAHIANTAQELLKIVLGE